jgi:ubiquitin-like-conjugating enzyme ATG3
MNTLKKSLYEGYKAAAEMVIPDLKDSNFLETGMLTKEEFRLSCDKLIEMDSTWSWMKEGECLMKKRILCNKIQLEQDFNVDEDINVYNLKETPETPETPETTVAISNEPEQTSDTESDDFLAEFETQDLVENDAATVKIDYDNLDKSHYYNVSITYDQYYRTPRIWFEGIDSGGSVLSQEEIYSDFMVEYIKVSLTLETHPIMNMNYISVHPCKHAFAMQKMFAFELEKKNESEVKIEDYIVHFLKFASCVIPQLEFDKTTI